MLDACVGLAPAGGRQRQPHAAADAPADGRSESAAVRRADGLELHRGRRASDLRRGPRALLQRHERDRGPGGARSREPLLDDDGDDDAAPTDADTFATAALWVLGGVVLLTMLFGGFCIVRAARRREERRQFSAEEACRAGVYWTPRGDDLRARIAAALGVRIASVAKSTAWCCSTSGCWGERHCASRSRRGGFSASPS